MAYLAEQCSAEETGSALAAYITGVVIPVDGGVSTRHQ